MSDDFEKITNNEIYKNRKTKYIKKRKNHNKLKYNSIKENDQNWLILK